MKVEHLVILLGLVAPASVLADDWYVDAAAASGGDGSVARPFAVIQDAVNAAGEGDTIHVAAGVYSNGVTTVSGGNSRICVQDKPSLKFIGAGRGKTIVVGSRDPNEEEFGSTEVPVRCAYVETSDGTIFTDFTFRDGEIWNDKSTLSAGNAGGGLYADSAEVYLVDCDIVHCSARYGAPAYQGTLVRCLVDDNYAVGGPGGRGVRFINSVITRSKASGGSSATLYECKLYNATVVDNPTTWAVQTVDDEIYNSLLLLSGNADIYRETNRVCRVENSVLSLTASKSFWQVMGPLAGDWRLLNDSDAVNAGASSWLTGLSLPSDVDALKDFAGNAIVPDAQGRINAGAIQTVVTPAGGALVFKAPHTVSVDGYAMRRAASANVGWVYPETYPTQYCVRANLEEGEALYRILRFDAAGNYYANVTDPGFVPREEGGAMYLLPPPSRAVNSTNQVVAATTVLWCDNDAYGREDADGSETHPYGTIQAALDVVASKTPTVIFVKPGVYSNDTTTSSTYGTFRVFGNSVNHYVRIASTDGADKTFVVGKPDASTLESETYPGCGAAAVKGLGLIGQNYVVQGLTVCGCYGPITGSSVKPGVAIETSADKPALVVDCVVSNCVSADSVCESGFYRRCVFRDNSSYVQIVSGTYLSSSFLADNDVTIGGTGNTGPLSGTAGAYNLTLVGPIRSGRLYSGGVTHFNTVFDGGANVYSGCRMTNSLAYNYKNSYCPDPFANQDPRFVARGTSPVVKTDSPAVGAGLVPTADNYGADYWKAMDGDLFGNPIVFSSSGAPTIGAAQTPVDFRTLTFATPANGGLATSEGATSGTFELVEGTADSVSFVPAAGTRPCAGLKIGETSYWFTNTADNVISFDYASLAPYGISCAVEPIYTTDWYVDDDGDDSRSGMLPSLARKTLTSAMSLCASGDTLWALPGTYDEGGATAKDAHTVSNRVVVKAGVTLRSTEGPTVTIIAGAEAPVETRDDSGCGKNAVRCVYLAGQNAKVAGFTLRDGRVNLLDSGVAEDQHGGGVLGNSGSDGRVPSKGYWVVDCLITNCVARFGAAVSRACLIRSKALGNTSVRNLVYQGSAYGSYIDRNVVENAVFDYCYDIVGSTVGPDNLTSAGKVTSVATHSIGNGGVFVNTLFCNPITPGGTGTTVIRNCVCAKGSDLSEHTDTDETVLVATDAVQVAIDANGSPILGSSIAVDAGDASWYAEGSYPTLDSETDLAGGQRVYNGRMDIGCNEADWRDRYATDLGRKRQLTVTRADPAVVETAAGVAISNGVLTVLWTNDRAVSTRYSFVAQVTGTGTLTVTLNGEAFRTLSAADGRVTIDFVSEAETQTLVFTYAPGTDDTGAAILSQFRRAGRGMIVIAR